MNVVIVANQDSNLKNLLNRAYYLGKEITIIYVLEKKVLDSLKGYSHHILPEHMVSELERKVLEMHRKEVENVVGKREKDVNFRETIFEVGNLREIAVKYITKLSPEIVICDENISRKIYGKIEKPMWIVKEGKIDRICCYVHSIIKIKRVRKYVETVKKISNSLGCELILIYPKYDDEGVKTLRAMHLKVMKDYRDECSMNTFDRESVNISKALKHKGDILLY